MAFNVMNPTVSLTGTAIEDYTDELAIGLNAINVRSSRDNAYIKQQCLFGTLIAEKLQSENVELSTEDTVACTDGIETVKQQNVDSRKLIKLDALNSLDGKSKEDLAKIFKVLILYKYHCIGYMYDVSIADLITTFNDSQLFWYKYRTMKKHKLTLSQAMIDCNIKFIHVTKTFGADSGLNIPLKQGAAYSYDDSPTCIFSENSNLDIKFQSVPINNGLPKMLTVQFNYTLCNILTSKDL